MIERHDLTQWARSMGTPCELHENRSIWQAANAWLVRLSIALIASVAIGQLHLF
jgi:hypothetical protein